MKTSSFLATLRTHAALPLLFRAGRDLVSPGYHLTEVKRVSYETMDCGAMTHRWSETQFELWVQPLAGLAPDRGHMPTEKFLSIVSRVEAELPLNRDARVRIHASFKGQPAALYDVDTVEPRDGKLWIELSPDQTRCKAAERRVASLTGGCCGTAASDQKDENSNSACCDSRVESATAACCT